MPSFPVYKKKKNAWSQVTGFAAQDNKARPRSSFAAPVLTSAEQREKNLWHPG